MSKKIENYRQCTLRQGTSYTVGFIPEKAAKKGNKVELPEFADGGFWEVLDVGIILDKESLGTQNRAFKQFSTTSLLKSKGGIEG